MPASAALRLRRAGLEVGVTAKLPWPDAQDGTVLAQDPPAHSQGIAQPSVNILVAAPDNASPDGYVMPDLTGIPVITAQAMLNKIGLKADTPAYADVSVPSASTGTEQPKPVDSAWVRHRRSNPWQARVSTRPPSSSSPRQNREEVPES